MKAGQADLIAAVATPTGRGGVGVIRLSGSRLQAVFDGLLGFTPRPRHAHFSPFLDADRVMLDEGIALYFEAPHSFTGEHVLELQGHGGPAVMQLLLARCLELGARLAEPGEFTRRAFLNNKLDLAQAESVADLIDAATTTAARAAVRSLSGEFSMRVRQLVDALIRLRMFTEATLDFPDEDIDFLEAADARGQLAAIRGDLAAVLATARRGTVLRNGLHVVLVGEPNVGKSSLLNRLAQEDVAIVTPIAGTTRDAIRSQVEIRGVALHIIDTAGLRETEDVVERIGIERTRAAIGQADLALVLVEARADGGETEPAVANELPAGLARIVVHNKCDAAGLAADAWNVGTVRHIRLSAKTGAGVALLEDAVLEQAGWQGQDAGAFLARERHVLALEEAASHLVLADELLLQIELFAEELRLAQEALSRITGEFTADDLLGEIFSRFCIGK